jgi:hypothetical protein
MDDEHERAGTAAQPAREVSPIKRKSAKYSTTFNNSRLRSPGEPTRLLSRTTKSSTVMPKVSVARKVPTESAKI